MRAKRTCLFPFPPTCLRTLPRPGWSIQRIRQFYMRKVKYTQQSWHEKLSRILEDFPKVGTGWVLEGGARVSCAGCWVGVEAGGGQGMRCGVGRQACVGRWGN